MITATFLSPGAQVRKTGQILLDGMVILPYSKNHHSFHWAYIFSHPSWLYINLSRAAVKWREYEYIRVYLSEILDFFFFLVAPTLGSLLPLLEHKAEFLQFLNQGQSVGLLGRVISSSQGLYLYTNTEKRTHIHKHWTSMPWVGFEPTVSASERAKTVHVLDRSATVTGMNFAYCFKNGSSCTFFVKRLSSCWRIFSVDALEI
jgi:hypothetical protein